MAWYPDTPELDFKKPPTIIYLEELNNKTLNAMDSVEIEDHIQAAANETAQAYHQAKGGNYEDCLLVVSMALSVTGNAIGGKVGALLVAKCEDAAKKACEIIYEEPLDEFDR